MSRSRSQISARIAVALGVALALGIASACGQIAAQSRWPDGAALIANTHSLGRLLEQIGQLEGTPLARRAAQLRASLPACPNLESRAESGAFSDLWPALKCRTQGSDLDVLAAAQGDRDLAFSLPLAGGQLVGALAIRPSGDIELELRLPRGVAGGLAGLGLPDERSPGAFELSGSQTLVHARVRPQAGLDLASLVPADSQGARLFRLKSELFSGVVLDGVWEIAIYLPEPGQPMPRTALALNFAHRAAAVAAMEGFIENLQEAWPVTRSLFQLGDADGACLLDLAIMPGLAPCYVATERALIVGWNAASLRKALDRQGSEVVGLGDSSQAVIHLDRFAEADRILSAAQATETSLHPQPLPWRRITVEGEPDAADFRLQFRLESEQGRS